MKFLKIVYIISILAAISLAACRKDVDEFIPYPIDTAGKMVTTNIGGVITDEAGEAISNVAITIGDKETNTDENGIFLIKNVLVNDHQAYVQAKKEGYFNGSRLLVLRERSTNNVRIQLLEKEEIGSFQNIIGGQVFTADGSSMTFDPNAVAYNNGELYFGEVHVYAKFIDPSKPEVIEQMPGDLRGINLNDREQLLSSFGMLAVELSADDGSPLNVATGKTVALSTKIPADLLNTSPDVIPMWYFDEFDGMWKEEGQATKHNGFYVGNVSHFSFWNCDYPYPLVNVKGRLMDEAGNPLVNASVKISIVDESYSGYGRTDSEGYYCGYIPQNFELVLEVLDNCQQAVYTGNIGAHSADVVLDDLVIQLPGNSMNLSGQLYNCSDDPVGSGYIIVAHNGITSNYFSGIDGKFDISILICNTTEITVTAFDIINQKQSQPLDVLVQPIKQLGIIRACDDIDQFIAYTLDGAQFLIPNPDIEVFKDPDWFTHISGAVIDSMSQTVIARILFTVPVAETIGTFQVDLADINYFQINNYAVENGIGDLDLEVTFTQYGQSPGDYIIGSFNGSLQQTLAEPTHTFTGTFRSKRK